MSKRYISQDGQFASWKFASANLGSFLSSLIFNWTKVEAFSPERLTNYHAYQYQYHKFMKLIFQVLSVANLMIFRHFQQLVPEQRTRSDTDFRGGKGGRPGLAVRMRGHQQMKNPFLQNLDAKLNVGFKSMRKTSYSTSSSCLHSREFKSNHADSYLFTLHVVAGPVKSKKRMQPQDHT